MQQLVRGTDAYAQRYKHDRNANVAWQDTLIVPLLVTNAKLFVAEYDPADVSLDTGQFAMPLPAKVLPARWVVVARCESSMAVRPVSTIAL